MKTLITALCFMLISSASFADTQTFKSFGDKKVYFSAFNSSFITPEIADTYKITRGKDKGLVNITLVEDNKTGGRTAEVVGSVSNIFAQRQELEFFEVREGDTVYYLAPFTFENEDFLTFTINVRDDMAKQPYSVTFQRTMYHD